MAEFNYKVKNQAGGVIEGLIEAPNQERAIDILHGKDLVILSIEEAKKNIFKKDLLASISKPNRKDIVIFTRQLSTLISADVSLVEGLGILAKQSEKESFKKVISEVSSAIEGGASISSALARFPKLFDQFYVSLVRSGEVSGKLDTNLLYLADSLERSAAMNSKIRGALSYPAFVLFAMVIVSVIMVIFVLPNLLSILKEAGVQELPITTKALIVITDFVNSNLILITILFVALVVVVFKYAKTPQGKLRFDRFKIVMPGFGKIIRNFYIARIAESLSTLVKSGVPILDGLQISSEVVSNIIFKNILLEARENVRGGGTISETFSKFEEFPPLVTSMIAVGEKTGRTDFMLDNIFRFYKTESENDIESISQIIEPALILVLGIGVALLVAAILLPIYSLVGAG